MILRSLSYSIKQFARTLKKMVSEDIAVTNFREYLRIRTEQPNPDYVSIRKKIIFNAFSKNLLKLKKNKFFCHLQFQF
uniref:Transposase n=1 Tax=Ascaris lumbricoides TaxID=6252 RepID=A0A0M3I9F1_ASCLU